MFRTFAGAKGRNVFFAATKGTPPWPRLATCIAYLKEIRGLLGRALNILLVWRLAGVSASRLGIVDAAAHQLLFQVISLANVATGSLGIVANATVARVKEAAGELAAGAAGRHLAYAGAVWCTVSALCLIAFKSSVLTALGADAEVAAHAGQYVPLLAACAATTWYKALEGGLIGRGETSDLNVAFTSAAGGCVLSLLLGGASSLGGIWTSLGVYYFTLAAFFSVAWWRRCANAAASA